MLLKSYIIVISSVAEFRFMKTNREQARRLLLSFFAVLMPFLASAQVEHVEIDGIWYNLASKDLHAEVTRDEIGLYKGDIVIPNTVQHNGLEYHVKAIASHAFYNCKELISVNLPEGLETIGSGAFKECQKMVSINIPQTVNKIGQSVFYWCHNLASEIVIPKGVTEIEYQTFLGCTSLTSIHLPQTITTIGGSAFHSCNKLAAITIPSSVTSIGSYAFWGCSSLASAIDIPSGVTELKLGTFYNCSNLTSVTIPESVTSMAGSVFNGCSKLQSITIPSKVKEIGSSIFANCSSLTSITLPEGLTTIGGEAFSYCSSLTSINIPGSVVEVGKNAFANCSNLQSIVIPFGVSEIDYRTFGECENLTSVTLPDSLAFIYSNAFAGSDQLIKVYCPAPVPPRVNNPYFDGYSPENATLYVLPDALAAYQSATPWNLFGNIVAITEDQPAEEGWSEWTTLGTAVTVSGKDAMMTNLRYWGEGAIEEWAEPITIDQRTDKADPSKHQLRLNGIFNAKEIILDYDSSTATITAGQQSTGYATNTAMIEEQGVPDPYDEFLFSIKSGSYRPVTGLIDLSGAFFYISDMFGFNLGFTLQIEGVTPPTFTAAWDRRYVGREGGEATLTVSFEAPIVKYRKLVLAPGESVSSSAVKALYAANPATDLEYEETDRPTTTVTCTEMGTYRVVLIPIGADGTAVLDYGITSLVSYAEPDYGTYEWEYLGESTVIEHVGSLLIPNGEQWEEVDGTWVNKYPWQSTVEGVQTYRRADNPNIIGLRNLYGDSHPYSSMFTYINRTQDWWVYIDITDPKDVRLLTTPVGVSSSQVGYGCFINQYTERGLATYEDGVITFPNGTVLLGNFVNQDFEAEFDFKVILPAGSTITEIPLDNGQLTIYDLTGRKVLDTESLDSGIYIVNGRKVFR